MWGHRLEHSAGADHCSYLRLRLCQGPGPSHIVIDRTGIALFKLAGLRNRLIGFDYAVTTRLSFRRRGAKADCAIGGPARPAR